MDFYSLLSETLLKHGPSGDEGEVRSFLETHAKKYCADIKTDVMGNLICHKPGNGAKIMFSAHMDSIGFLVTHFEEKGFVRVARLGGISPQELLYSSVKFKNGVVGVLLKDEGTAISKLTMDELVLDIGAKDEDEAKSMISLGDTAVLAIPAQKIGDKDQKVVAPYLDNRVACAILLEMMCQLKDDTTNDIYYVFSSQEEVGLRGATTASYAIDPDFGIAIDVTDVNDCPDTQRHGTTALGDGAAIKIMDRSVICHKEVVQTLELLAKEQAIKVQHDILKSGGTDAGVIHKTRAGVKTGGISIPCRNIHTAVEMVSLFDIEQSIKLGVAFSKTNLK